MRMAFKIIICLTFPISAGCTKSEIPQEIIDFSADLKAELANRESNIESPTAYELPEKTESTNNILITFDRADPKDFTEVTNQLSREEYCYDAIQGYPNVMRMVVVGTIKGECYYKLTTIDTTYWLTLEDAIEFENSFKKEEAPLDEIQRGRLGMEEG